MQLTPGTTIERGDLVTRQTIYDLVANAVGGTVQESDLHESVQDVITQSEAPTPYPGKMWFDQTEQLMKVFTDELDDTGVSVWLSVGPDRFDVALLAAEPIPYGAAVQLVGDNRWAKLPPDPITLKAMGEGYYEWQIARIIGFNNNGTLMAADTVASGSWFTCAVDGFLRTWHPCNQIDYTSFGGLSGGQDSLLYDVSQMSGPSGISEVRGGIARDYFQGEITKNRGAYLIPSWQKIQLNDASTHDEFYLLQQFNGPHIANHWN